MTVPVVRKLDNNTCKNYVATLSIALRPSVACLRFSQNRKGAETSNVLET